MVTWVLGGNQACGGDQLGEVQGFCEGPICLMHQSLPLPARIWLDKRASAGQLLTQGRIREGETKGRRHLCPDAGAQAPGSQEENCAKIIKDPDSRSGPTWVQSRRMALMSFDL